MTGTGRCGTKSFARACSHLTSHTSGHETHAGRLEGYLDSPEDHIEVDPHLSWHLARLIDRYPQAYYVHLWRPEVEVVDSWRRRGILTHRGAAPLVDVIFQVRSRDLSAADYRTALCGLYRSITATCERMFMRRKRSMAINIHEAADVWPDFCEAIGAEGDIEGGAAELRRGGAH